VAFTVFEALHGIEDDIVKKGGLRQPWEEPRRRIGELVANCIVLPFNETAAEIAAHVFPRLVPRLDRERRKRIWADIFIAATAVAHRYGLVSHNRKDFEAIADQLPGDQILYLAVWKP